SRHPALVVGAAVDQDGAWPLAIQLAERLNAAVWESPMSGRRSFPEDHPLFAGFLPPLRQPLADRLAPYDVVLVIGAPVFTYHVHTGGSFAPAGTRLFHLTDDPQQHPVHDPARNGTAARADVSGPARGAPGATTRAAASGTGSDRW